MKKKPLARRLQMVANGEKQDSAGGEANGHQICKLKNHSFIVL